MITEKEALAYIREGLEKGSYYSEMFDNMTLAEIVKFAEKEVAESNQNDNA